MNLDDIRRKINTIDFEILKLLNSRMEFALRTKTLKPKIADTQRENQVIDYIHRHSQGLIEPEFCKRLFSEIIAESRRLQGESLQLIGFRGEHGSHAEVAARLFNPDVICISCQEFREIFDTVERGLLNLGIVPVENTLGGNVSDVNEFLVTSNIQIIGELKIPIHYCLLALPGTDPEDIRVVYSHRQALSHCQNFLDGRGLEGRPFYDAAAAAKMLVQERPKGSAAIASSFAADYYNLEIIAREVEDIPDNLSRFLILSRDATAETGNKCSVIFVAEHKAGSLFRVLSEFAEAGINLTRIESMPNRHDPGNYIFFLDFQGSIEDENVVRVLGRVEAKSLMYKFLGCYPAAPNQRDPGPGR